MNTIDLMPVPRPEFNLMQAPPPSLPINDAIRIKSAEFWLKLGETDEALRELEELRQTWNHPSAVKVRVAALDVLGEGGRLSSVDFCWCSGRCGELVVGRGGSGRVEGVKPASVTIAPRNPAKGVINFVVTLTTHKDVRSYPCRSMESAIKLAERFIAGVIKPRPAAHSETTPAPAAEPVAAAA